MRVFVEFAEIEPNLKKLEISQDEIQKILKAVKDPSGYKLKNHDKDLFKNSRRKSLNYFDMTSHHHPDWELLVENEYIKNCQDFEIHKIKEYHQTPNSLKIHIFYKVDYFGDVTIPQFEPEKAVAGGICL